jgi:hypothetical protein
MPRVSARASHKAGGETRIVARAKSIYPQTPYAHGVVMKGYGHLSVQIKFSACLVTRAKASSQCAAVVENFMLLNILRLRDILATQFWCLLLPK